MACCNTIGGQCGVSRQSDVREAPSGGGYHTERLDDVDTRLARIEGKMPHMASKEDVANAKLFLYLSWTGAAISLLVGLGLIAARLVIG